VHPLDDCGLVDLRAVTTADRGELDGPSPALDWRFVGLMA
jgi:hypothetical protein